MLDLAARPMNIPNLGLLNGARPYLDNTRMRDWGGYVGMAILGYLQGMEAAPQALPWYFNFAMYLASVALYLSFSFSVNNCFDYKGDRLGAKRSLNPIASGRISAGGGILFSCLLATLGLSLTWSLFGAASFATYAGMLILSASYSVPPLRLKSMPVLDVASHGLFFGSLIVLFGVTVAGGFNAFTLPLLLSVYNISLIIELRNQIDDIREDSATGVETTAVCIGLSRANILFYGLLAIHMAMLTYIVSLLGNAALSWLAVLFFVGMGVYFYQRPNRDRFLLLVERVTPLVYVLFIMHLIL